LQQQLALRAESVTDSRYNDTAHLVANFILNFEEEIERSDPFRKKSLMRQCISGILVDGERRQVHLAVRRIPAVTSELEYLLQNKTVATKVMTAVSSGGRRCTCIEK
jgi:hypothetical protein